MERRHRAAKERWEGDLEEGERGRERCREIEKLDLGRRGERGDEME